MVRRVKKRKMLTANFYWSVVVGIALCTAFMFVTCLLLIAGTVTSIDLIGPTNFSQVVAAFIPYGLVTLYVLEAISVRIFARWWDDEPEGPQTLGLGKSDESKTGDR